MEYLEGYMKKRNVLILGASGMLGSMVLNVLSRQRSLRITATVRDYQNIKKLTKKYGSAKFRILDVLRLQEDDLGSLVKEFDYIINAIGLIKPFINDFLPDDNKKALLINTLFPFKLAKAMKNTDTRVIQIATDCVFSGKQGKRNEHDPHDPLDVYGKTKSLGEVQEKNFYHLRCSIIGPEQSSAKSLLEWVLCQPKDATVKGYTNHFWNGLTTLQFAKIVDGIIRNDIIVNKKQHIIPADSVTKKRLIEHIVSIYHRNDIRVIPHKAQVKVDRSLVTNNPDINKQLWQAAGYISIPTIKTMLNELAGYTKNKR